MRETPKALSAYEAYASLGPDRSLIKLAQMYGKSTAYVRQLERWSSAFRWVDRATFYDAQRRAEEEEFTRKRRAEEREAYARQRSEDQKAIRTMLLRHINAANVEPSSTSQIQAGKLLTEQYVIVDELMRIKEELQAIKGDLIAMGDGS